MDLTEAIALAKRLEEEGSCGTMGLALRALLRGYTGACLASVAMEEEVMRLGQLVIDLSGD